MPLELRCCHWNALYCLQRHAITLADSHTRASCRLQHCRPSLHTLALAKPHTEPRKKKIQRKPKPKEVQSTRETLSESGYEDTLRSDVVVAGDADGDNADDEVQNDPVKRAELKQRLSEILCNAQRLKAGSSARFSMGIDFGDARTGVAISKGFVPRPVEVVQLQGQKLEARLMEIADREGAVELVVGLPKSSTGQDTPQCHKIRCFAGRLAVLAAQRGWCVFLHDEFGSSLDAFDYMLSMGSTKKSRKTQIDAYAAVVLLQMYFENCGEHAELVVPKKLSLQARLCEGPALAKPDDDDDVDW